MTRSGVLGAPHQYWGNACRSHQGRGGTHQSHPEAEGHIKITATQIWLEGETGATRTAARVVAVSVGQQPCQESQLQEHLSLPRCLYHTTVE